MSSREGCSEECHVEEFERWTPLQPNKGDGIEQATTELTVTADKSIDIYIDDTQQILQQNSQCSQFGLLSLFNN